MLFGKLYPFDYHEPDITAERLKVSSDSPDMKKRVRRRSHVRGVSPSMMLF